VWARTHRDAWSAAWVAVERADQHAVAIDDALVASEQRTADAFSEAGLIPAKVDIKSTRT
jgi:hypothetical protein